MKVTIAGDSLVLEPKLCSAGELRVFSLAADTPIPDPWSRVRRSLTDESGNGDPFCAGLLIRNGAGILIGIIQER